MHTYARTCMGILNESREGCARPSTALQPRVVTDRLPLGTPGRIAPVPETDTLLVGGIQRTIAGDLTFEDSVTGVKTLAQLAAGGGGGIGGSSGVIDNALIRADGTGGATVQAGATGATLADDGTMAVPFALVGAAPPSGIAALGIGGGVAAAGGVRAVQISGDAGGFSDVSAIAISYLTGASPANVHQSAILVSVDDRLAGGGGFAALEVSSTGNQPSVAILAGPQVAPIYQGAGTMAAAAQVLVVAVDQTAALAGTNANVNVFVANGNTMTIGGAAKFARISFTLDIVAGAGGITPTFEFSTGVGTWGALGATDGTSGMRQSGVVSFDPLAIPTWVVGAGGFFLVRITRTNNAGVAGNARCDALRVSVTDAFYWDKSARLRFLSCEIEPVNANPGSTPTLTTWRDSTASNRIKDGTNTLAFLSEIPAAGIGGSVGTVDNRIPVSVGTGGATLEGGLITSDPTTGATSLVGTMADTTPLLTFGQSGVNGSTVNWTFSTRTPVGNITGTPGDVVLRKSGTTSSVYLHIGAGSDNTSWIDISGTIRGTVGVTANRVPLSSGTGGATLAASLLTIDPTTGSMSLAGTMADTSPLLSWSQTGTNGTASAMHFGSRDPEGLITALPGAIYVRTNGVSSQIYQLRSAASANTPWVASGTIIGTMGATANRVPVTSGTGGQTLQASSLTVATTGAITVTSTLADSSPIFTSASTGSNGGSFQTFCGIRNPEGLVSGNPGDRYIRINGTSSTTYQLKSAGAANTPWVDISAGTYLAAGNILHAVRRSVQITNVTSTVFIGYDTVLKAINASYWSYSAGSWTCLKVHTSRIATKVSYKVNSGATQAVLACDIVQGVGGSYTNNLQTHTDSAYSTTDTNGHLTNWAIRTWAVNEQFRIYYYSTIGGSDLLAAQNECNVEWVSDT